MVVGMGSPRMTVSTWYNDGTVSIGTSWDLTTRRHRRFTTAHGNEFLTRQLGHHPQTYLYSNRDATLSIVRTI